MNETSHIKAGYLIDGRGSPIQKNVLLTIWDERVQSIEQLSPNVSLPPGTTDLSHCTLVPPLTDTHVHLSMESTIPERSGRRKPAPSPHKPSSLIARNLYYHFIHGVLSVRDCGDRYENVFRFRQHTNENLPPMTITTSGPAWYKKGCYGSFLGHPLDEQADFTKLFDEHEPFCDFIKIIQSGINSLQEFGLATDPQFTTNQLRQIVTLAGQKGKKVSVHANGEKPVRMTIEAGCHSVEHGFFMGKENLKRMADMQIAWCPTAVTMKVLSDPKVRMVGPHERGVAQKNLEHQLEQLTIAREYGVKVVLGTDAGSPGVLHGESAAEELKLFLKAGYSLPEAIECACSNGASLLDLHDTGIIAAGKPANFLVARASPATLPRKLSYLEAIYINGKPCSRDFFNKI